MSDAASRLSRCDQAFVHLWGFMELNDYQKQAMKTKQGTADLLYSVTKLHCEAGELAQPVIKQQYHGKPLDVDGMIEEAGDLLWIWRQSRRTSG